MIVSALRRFVYVGPPKTGSTALHEWLSQPLLCSERWEPWKPQVQGIANNQHDVDVPRYARDWYTIASYRHPCARAVSLWAHSLASGHREDPPVPQLDFPGFLDWLPGGPPFYSRSLASFLGGLRLDAIILPARFGLVRHLPPFAPFADRLESIPRSNATRHPPWREIVDEALAAKIRALWPDDFELAATGPVLGGSPLW